MDLKSLTDEQFEQYLLTKYGPDWFNVPLTQDELDRFPRVTDKDVAAALKVAANQNYTLASDSFGMSDDELK